MRERCVLGRFMPLAYPDQVEFKLEPACSWPPQEDAALLHGHTYWAVSWWNRPKVAQRGLSSNMIGMHFDDQLSLRSLLALNICRR